MVSTIRQQRSLGRLLTLTIALSSCQSVVELDLPPPKPQLVVNGVVNPDSLFTIDISASQSVFTNQPTPPVNNTVVQVYQMGRYLENLQQVRPGYYRGSQRPQPLQQYELRAATPGFPSVSATTELPALPITREVQARALAATNTSVATVEASFVLADVPAQADFYCLQAYTSDIDVFNNKPYKRSVSVTFAAPFPEEFSMGDRYFFSDRLFNGQPLKLVLRLENSPTNVTYLRVAHISGPYYDYARGLVKQSYTDNSITNMAPVANNIHNGLGLFGSYTAQTLNIKP